MDGLHKAQEGVEEVTKIMIENLNKVEERDEKLSDLEDRAEELRKKGQVFEKSTKILMEQKKSEYEGTKIKKKVIWGVVGAVVSVLLLGLLLFVVI